MLAGVLVTEVHFDARDSIGELRQRAFEHLLQPLRNLFADPDVIVVVDLYLHASETRRVAACSDEPRAAAARRA
jgi:hypothetical protein